MLFDEIVDTVIVSVDFCSMVKFPGQEETSIPDGKGPDEFILLSTFESISI